MSPLDRIANVSTLKVNLISYHLSVLSPEKLLRKTPESFQTLCLPFFILQQHEVDKLYKVEYKPVISTSDQ